MKCVSRIDLALMFVFGNILINLDQLKNLAFDPQAARHQNSFTQQMEK